MSFCRIIPWEPEHPQLLGRLDEWLHPRVSSSLPTGLGKPSLPRDKVSETPNSWIVRNVLLTCMVFTPPQAVVIWLILPKSTEDGKFDILTLQLGFCTMGTARRLLFCTVDCGLRICWNCGWGGLPEVSMVRSDGVGLCMTCGVEEDRAQRWGCGEWLKKANE